MPRKKSIASANGERRAIVGYDGQYRTQACLLLRALQEGDLEWVKIIDPKAEKLDDFQIGRPGRIDAYQVKWSEHPGAITFNSLGSKGFLMAMADGWSVLGSAYSPKRLVAHFVTNNHASSSAEMIPFGSSRKPKPAHFRAFLKQIWEPIKERKLSASQIPEEWLPAWAKFQKATGLKGDKFDNFVDNFELDWDFRAEAAPYTDGRDAAKWEDRIRELEGFFIGLVASPERAIHLTRDELLRRLGWAAHFEFRSLHKFPVDLTRYEPLEESAKYLKQALEENKQGYVCVLGSPGSGKSTLLTDILGSATERVIRYYAFIPDDMGSTTVRGESANFLHDVTLSLEKVGYRPNCLLARAETRELRNAFYHQIQLAGTHFRETQCRTLILIDGLDHVRREQAQYLEREFFGDLPLPAQVPEGVLFVLGSQTLDPLAPQIKSQLESSQTRIVTTAPLTPFAVGMVLDRSGLHDLSARQRKQVFDHSAGHPLALRFIVNLLGSQSGGVDEILKTVPQFSGDIDATYRAYWEDLVANDDDLWELMASIARLRHQFDLRWVMKWAPSTAVRKLENKFAHFFTREGERYSFFHNSFRQFVVMMTSRSSNDEGRDHHSRLAEIYEKFPWSWNSERLYHLAEAGAHEQVLVTATQEFFRVQFFNSRPADAILQDIRLAKRSLRHVHDPVAAVRLSLASTEIWKRDDNLNAVGESPGGHNLLLATGHVEEAIAQVRRGMSLLVSPRGAIRWSRDFLTSGHDTEARRVFSLIDPVSGAKEPHGFHPQDDQQDFLVEWAVAALDQSLSSFSIKRVIGVILSCEFDVPENSRLDIEKPPGLMRNKALTRIAIDLLDEGKNDLVPRFESSLDQEDESYSGCIHELEMSKANGFFERGDLDASRATLDAEFSRVKKERLSLNNAAVFNAAELYARLHEFTRTRDLMKAIKKPTPPRNFGNGSSAFVPLFRYYRLSHVLGHAHEASEVKSLTENRSLGNYVKFDGHLNDLAWISSCAWIGKILSSETLEPLILTFLDFYESTEIESLNQDFYLEIKYSRSQFNDWLIDACIAQGDSAITLLVAELEKRWANPRQHHYWHSHVQRQFVTALFQAGAGKEWAIHRLELLESEISKIDGGSDVASECSEQADAWLTIGEPIRADAMRDKMMRSSFQVGYRKDNQLVVWLRLVGILLEDQPDNLLRTLRWFSKCVVGLDWAVESTTVDDAASELVGVCADIHPAQAYAYLGWFGKNSVLHGQDALVSFLLSLVNRKEAPLDKVVRIMSRILLPQLENGNWYLAERLVVRLFDSLEHDSALTMTEELVDAANVLDDERKKLWCYGLARGTLLSGVALQKVGLTGEALRFHAKENSGDNLQREAGVLTMDELEFSNLTVEDLRGIRNSARTRADFNWHRLIKRIASKFDKAELLSITDDFRDDRKFILIIEAISERLVALGGTDELRTLAREAFKDSNPDGWKRYYDGGTRMAAFNLLYMTDRPAALRLLYEDCADHEPLDPTNLRHLLPLIATSEQRRSIWLEIQEHLQNLLEGFDENIEEPPVVTLHETHLGDQFSEALASIFGWECLGGKGGNSRVGR